MKNPMNSVCVLFSILILGFFSQSAFAQDATKVDSTHYKVEFENDQVRVLRITYGPGEKSVMHSHGGSVAIYLTESTARMTFPDGTSQKLNADFGTAEWAEAGEHLPQNVGDKSVELVIVELKD